MARTDNLTNFLTDIANAIREKKGTSDKILASNFDTEIASIETGGGTSSEFVKGTFTLNEDVDTYTVNDLPFTPSFVIVSSETLGILDNPRTVYWQITNSFSKGFCVSYKKETSLSATIAINNNYGSIEGNSFTIERYLALPILSGKYTYIAVK